MKDAPPMLDRTVFRAIILPALLLVPAGCRSLFEADEYLPFVVPAEEFTNATPVDLRQLSGSDGTSIEDALQDMEDAVRGESLGDSIELRLDDVRAAALRNNLDLKVELVNPKIAETSVTEEEARFEAVFVGSVNRNKVDSPTPTPLIAGSNTTFDSYDAGVRIPLRTGGNISVNLPFSKTATNNPSAFLDPSYNADLQFSISQPLLRNAGSKTNLNALRVARGQAQITSARTKLEAIRILANADRAFWRLYAALRELEVRQQQYELAVEQLRRAERRVKAGDQPEVEVFRAESGVAQSLEAIIRTDSAVRRRRRDLKRIMNRDDLPINGPTAILTATEPDPVWFDLDPDRLTGYAVENRMEMLELEIQLAIDASNIDFQRNQKLPLFTLDYTYSPSGLGTTFGNAFDQLDDRSFEDWSLGLSAEIPIGNEAARSRLHRAVLTRLQRLSTKEQRDLVIRQEVLDALDALEESWQRILAARQESRLSGRTYEAEKRQFDQGLRTSTDVLDAAATLADAQSSEVRALSDYQIAQIDLAFATGTLLGKGRVRWESDVDGGP